MNESTRVGLREEVRARCAAVARAVLEPATAGCCGLAADAWCGIAAGAADAVGGFGQRLYREGEESDVGCIAGALSRAEYLDGRAATGSTGASVTFTHEAAPGLYAAIIRAAKPASA
jgi:hypothetical protein